MTGIGLVMIGAAIALLVANGLRSIYRCGLCKRPTMHDRRLYGGLMTGRFCPRCHVLVAATDTNGAVEVIERDLSKAISTLQLEAA